MLSFFSLSCTFYRLRLHFMQINLLISQNSSSSQREPFSGDCGRVASRTTSELHALVQLEPSPAVDQFIYNWQQHETIEQDSSTKRIPSPLADSTNYQNTVHRSAITRYFWAASILADDAREITTAADLRKILYSTECATLRKLRQAGYVVILCSGVDLS